MNPDDFYEDDEPIEDVLRAWNESTDGGFTEGSKALPIRTVVWPIDFVCSP